MRKRHACTVLGVSPGLSALSYCVVGSTPSVKARHVDYDVLHARALSREAKQSPSKRARVHQLVLGVVLERDPPDIIAIGPVHDRFEELAHVEAARDMLTQIALTAGARVVDFPRRQQLVYRLGDRAGRALGHAVNDHLVAPLGAGDRRIVLAAATALAGWLEEGIRFDAERAAEVVPHRGASKAS